ncbi:MAG: apolipoprotein N-acyltransferase [bacterium]|nr:apolipoprotein N-acyltransferase [bacterium]
MVRRVLAVLAGAGCYAAALPPFDHPIAGWLTLVPLLLVVRRRRPLAAGGFGALYGFACGWAVTWWLTGAVASYFAAGIVAGAVAMSAAYLVAIGATFGAFAAGAAVLMRHGGGFPTQIAIAALWVACELVRGRVFGQPWALLGYTQHDVTPLLQLTAATGIYGLSFVVALGSVGIADALAALRGPGRRAALRRLAGPAAVVIGVALAGEIRVARGLAPAAGARAVVVVQSNVPPAFHWTRAFAEAQFLANVRLTETIAQATRPALVVWPENAVTLYLEHEPFVARTLARLAARLDADLLIGGPRWAAGRTYNSVRLVRPDGTAGGHYDKRRLVPFAESPPLAVPSEAGPLESPRAFSPGTDPGLLAGFTRLGVSICHELLYPDVVHDAVAAGATVLVNVANDGWLDAGHGIGSRQHFAMAKVRAVEAQRFLVRAATTGVSAVVDPFGRTVTAAPTGLATIASAQVVPETALTPYVRFGDWFAFACLAWALVALARALGAPAAADRVRQPEPVPV